MNDDRVNALYEEYSQYIESSLQIEFAGLKKAGIYYSAEDQEDICQVVRMKVWRYLHRFDSSRATAKTYIYMIIRRQIRWVSMAQRGDGRRRSNAEFNYQMLSSDDDSIRIAEPYVCPDREYELMDMFSAEERRYIELKAAGCGVRAMRREIRADLDELADGIRTKLAESMGRGLHGARVLPEGGPGAVVGAEESIDTTHR